MRAAGNVSSTILNMSYVAKTAPIIISFLIILIPASYSAILNWSWIIFGLNGKEVLLKKTAGVCESSFPGSIWIAAKVILNNEQNLFVQNCDPTVIKQHLTQVSCW
jgi:hypothetical protein